MWDTYVNRSISTVSELICYSSIRGAKARSLNRLRCHCLECWDMVIAVIVPLLFENCHRGRGTFHMPVEIMFDVNWVGRAMSGCTLLRVDRCAER